MHVGTPWWLIKIAPKVAISGGPGTNGQDVKKPSSCVTQCKLTLPKRFFALEYRDMGHPADSFVYHPAVRVQILPWHQPQLHLTRTNAPYCILIVTVIVADEDYWTSMLTFSIDRLVSELELDGIGLHVCLDLRMGGSWPYEVRASQHVYELFRQTLYKPAGLHIVRCNLILHHIWNTVTLLWPPA